MDNQHIGAYGLAEGYVYGRAFDQLVKLPNGAGNVTYDYAIGGTYVERLTSVSFQLAAAAGGGVRTPVLDFLDGEGVIFSGSASPFTIAATNTSTVTFAVGVNEGGANNSPRIVVPLVPTFLQATYTVRLSFINGAAGDAVTAIRILTTKFSTAPADFSPGQGTEVSRRQALREPVPEYVATV